MTLTWSRREANKARTREAILDAAIALLHEPGAPEVTAERVAEQAGISRRTFFNYFPNVDAVFGAHAGSYLDAVGTALAARPVDEPMADSAVAVLEDIFTTEVLALATTTWRIVDANPGARRFVLEAQSAAVVALARDWVAVRRRAQGRETGPVVVAMLAAAALSAYDTASQTWFAEHTGPVDDAARAAFLARIHEAFGIVRPVFETP